MRPVPTTQRWPTTHSSGGLVCSVDHLASSAGAQILGVAGVQPNVALYLNDAPASTPGRTFIVSVGAAL